MLYVARAFGTLNLELVEDQVLEFLEAFVDCDGTCWGLFRSIDNANWYHRSLTDIFQSFAYYPPSSEKDAAPCGGEIYVYPFALSTFSAQEQKRPSFETFLCRIPTTDNLF